MRIISPHILVHKYVILLCILFFIIIRSRIKCLNLTKKSWYFGWDVAIWSLSPASEIGGRQCFQFCLPVHRREVPCDHYWWCICCNLTGPARVPPPPRLPDMELFSVDLTVQAPSPPDVQTCSLWRTSGTSKLASYWNAFLLFKCIFYLVDFSSVYLYISDHNRPSKVPVPC